MAKSNVVTKTFPKAALIDLTEGFSDDDLELLEDAHLHNSRWAEFRALVFLDKQSGKMYKVNYSLGLTELQDHGPFDHDPDDIECTEVEAVVVERHDYRAIKKNS